MDNKDLKKKFEMFKPVYLCFNAFLILIFGIISLFIISEYSVITKQVTWGMFGMMIVVMFYPIFEELNKMCVENEKPRKNK